MMRGDIVEGSWDARGVGIGLLKTKRNFMPRC